MKLTCGSYQFILSWYFKSKASTNAIKETERLLLAFLLYMKPKGNHSVYSGGKKICQTFVKVSVVNSDPAFRLLIGANRRADEQVRVAMPAG